MRFLSIENEGEAGEEGCDEDEEVSKGRNESSLRGRRARQRERGVVRGMMDDTDGEKEGEDG